MIALLVGRWQPFHKGHEYLIDKTNTDFQRTIIGVGSSEKSRTKENPLTYEERKSTIKACYPQIKIFPVEDVGDDELWIEEIEESLHELGIESPKQRVISVSMSDWTQRCFRKAGYQTGSYKLLKPEKFDGTSIRKLIREGKNWKDLIPHCARQKIESFGLEKILNQTE